MAGVSQPRSAPGGLVDFFYSRRLRSVVAQILLVAAIMAGAAYLLHNAAINLEKRGIASGFDFLGQTAGFDVAMSLIPHDATMTYGRVLLVGALNTLLVSVLGIVSATILGVVLGVVRLSDNWLAAKLVGGYVELVRNVPLLLQILFWYGVMLGLPKVRESIVLAGGIVMNNRGLYVPRPLFEPGAGLVGLALGLGVVLAVIVSIWARRRQLRTGRDYPDTLVGLALIAGLPTLTALALGVPWTFEFPEFKGFNYQGGYTIILAFFALWLSLTTYTAAFIAEIVRAGILSVSPGQREAAAALGITRGKTMRLIILPQALRVIIPPMTSQYLNLTKNSSLAVAIGYPDIIQVFAGTTLNQTGQAVEVIAITMAFYLAISLLISLAMNLYNRAIALKGR